MSDWKSLGPFKLPPDVDAVDFIKLPSRVLPPGWKAVTEAKVAEMLRQAGAPEPWIAPELACYALAQCINNPLGYQTMLGGSDGIIEAKPKPKRTEVHRARDAIDELLRVLPSVIAVYESNTAECFRVYSSSSREAERLRETQRIPQATFEILKQVLTLLKSLPPRRRAKPWWHFDAAKLFDIYRHTIDPSAGLSAGGPAVRFIRKALGEIGYRHLPNPSGIASALRRTTNWSDEFLRRRVESLVV
jgi:hypothetical protein